MPARFTARTDADLIALAPIVLGFTPTRSLVMLTFTSFHARIDLPEEQHYDEFVETLVSPAVRHDVERVAFIVFDEGDWNALMAQLIARFDRAKIEVLAALQVADDKYRKFGHDWKPLDLATNPLTLQAHYQDLSPRHDSRAKLVEYVKPCGEEPTPEVASLLLMLREEGVEGFLNGLSRVRAHETRSMLVSAIRSLDARSELVPDVAVALAWVAWLSGDGAMAWVAADMADPENRLTQLITVVLEGAVNPSAWDELLGNV